MHRLVAAPAVVAIVSVATAGHAFAATDSDRVRAVLDMMNASYNRSDFDAFAAHLCTGMRHTVGFEAGWYVSRTANGPTRITVNSVNVGGDPANLAVANVRFEAANREDAKTLDVEFIREGTDWKACRYRGGQTV
jgi:hypothetical protein